MEEFFRQAREFEQSIWGGLFYFLGGAFFATSPFWSIQRQRLGLNLLGIAAVACWNVVLFLDGHWIFGDLLIPIVLAGIARTLVVEIRERKQRA